VSRSDSVSTLRRIPAKNVSESTARTGPFAGSEAADSCAAATLSRKASRYAWSLVISPASYRSEGAASPSQKNPKDVEPGVTDPSQLAMGADIKAQLDADLGGRPRTALEPVDATGGAHNPKVAAE